MTKKTILETKDLNITGFYFVKHRFRSDLNYFTDDLNKIFVDLENSNFEITVFECEFWKVTPKFIKVTKAKLKILFAGHLSEKQRGWHKDHYNYNKRESWEITPAKRKTPARNYSKK